MFKLGIIPAAGEGRRWGYYPKFLLPCGEKEWLLDRTIRAMPCEKSVIVFRKDTVGTILNHLEKTGLRDRVILVEQVEPEILGAVQAAIQIEADYYYFGMPDTYWPTDVFSHILGSGIALGTFYTNHPERFGMVRDGAIVDKQAGSPGMAWGTLGWDREVRDLWQHLKLRIFADAITLAMHGCEWNSYNMAYYYDMSDWDAYRDFIRNRK